MKYKDYIGYTKAYVLVHNTGFGVPECPNEEQDIVYETDDYEEAVKESERLKFANNTAEEIESSWYNNSYHVNVNTLSEKGKEIYKKFTEEFEECLAKMKSNPNYTSQHYPGIGTVHLIQIPDFEPLGNTDLNEPPDFSKMKIRFFGPKNDEKNNEA